MLFSITKLRKWNALIWARDGSCCIICGSPAIIGEPFVSGAHHIFSRGAHPELMYEPRNGCLACVKCHENANTERKIRKFLFIMRLKYGYSYEDAPYSSYIGSRVEPE